MTLSKYAKMFFKELLGLDEIEHLITRLEDSNFAISENQKKIMATVKEIINAISNNLSLTNEVLVKVNGLGTAIKKAIEDAIAGIATPEQLTKALEDINASNSALEQVKDVLMQTIPGTSAPISDVEVPEVGIISTPDDEGLPGSVDIQVM